MAKPTQRQTNSAQHVVRILSGLPMSQEDIMAVMARAIKDGERVAMTYRVAALRVQSPGEQHPDRECFYVHRCTYSGAFGWEYTLYKQRNSTTPWMLTLNWMRNYVTDIQPLGAFIDPAALASKLPKDGFYRG